MMRRVFFFDPIIDTAITAALPPATSKSIGGGGIKVNGSEDASGAAAAVATAGGETLAVAVRSSVIASSIRLAVEAVSGAGGVSDALFKMRLSLTKPRDSM